MEFASNDGSFREEIVVMEVAQRKRSAIIFDKDEHFRQGLRIEDLQKLPPAFVADIGKVTAGNSRA